MQEPGQEETLSWLKTVAAWGRPNSMSASLPYPRVLRLFYSMIKGSLCIYILKSASWKHWRIPKLPFLFSFLLGAMGLFKLLK